MKISLHQWCAIVQFNRQHNSEAKIRYSVNPRWPLSTKFQSAVGEQKNENIYNKNKLTYFDFWHKSDVVPFPNLIHIIVDKSPMYLKTTFQIKYDWFDVICFSWIVNSLASSNLEWLTGLSFPWYKMSIHWKKRTKFKFVYF